MERIARKHLLSKVRAGDWSHAGEVEAIECMLRHLPQAHYQTYLDVGSGLGGTAEYIRIKQQAKVTGIDIDPQAILHARSTYPQIDFIQSDVMAVTDRLTGKKFDVIYAMNAYYAFTQPVEALKQLAQMLQPHGVLALFDYSSEQTGTIQSPFLDENRRPQSYFNPLRITTIESELMSAGWCLRQKIDLTDSFITWYTQLIQGLEQNKIRLIDQFGKAVFEGVYLGFIALRESLYRKQLGGLLLYATLQSESA